MSTITSSANAALNQINQSAQDWNTQYMNLSQEQEELNSEMSDEQSQVDDLNDQINGYDAQLSDLEGQLDNASDDDKPAIQAQIDAINGEIVECNDQIDQLNQNMAANQETYVSLAPNLMTNSNVTIKNSEEIQQQETEKEQDPTNTATDDQSSSLMTTDTLTTDDTTDDTTPTDSTDTDPSSTDPLTQEELATQTQELINDEIAQINIMTQQMWADFNNIVQDDDQIAQDQAQIDALNDQITQDAIKLGACAAASVWTGGLSLGGAAYYASAMADEINKRNALQGEVSELQSKVAALTAEIDGLIQQLSVMTSNVMTEQMQQITDQVKSVLTSLMSAVNSGQVSEAQVQQATVAIVAVMSLLQTMLAQIYNDRSQDQQDMSKAGAQNYSMAVNQSSVDARKFSESVAQAKFMKTVMDVAQVAIATAGVVAAVATGGAGSIALAAGMAVLTAVSMSTNQDYLGDAMSDLGTAIANKFGTSNAVGKVLADIIVAVALAVAVMVTDGAAAGSLAKMAGKGAEEGAAAGLTTAAKTAAKPVALEMTTYNSSVIEEEGGDEAAQVSKEIVEELTKEAMTGTTKQAASTFTENFKKALSTTFMMMMMNNTLVDLAQVIAEASEGKDKANKDQILKIMKIILGVLQVVLAVYAGGKAFGGGESTTSSISKLIGKLGLNQADLALFGRLLQGSGNATSILGNSLQAKNAAKLANIYEDLGSQKSVMLIYQSIMDANKASEKAYSEDASTQMQQLAAAIQEMISKFYSGEKEAARLIAHMAV